MANHLLAISFNQAAGPPAARFWLHCKMARSTPRLHPWQLLTAVFDGAVGDGQLHGDQGVAAAVRHGLKAAGDSAVGRGALSRSGAPRRLPLDLAHAQVALGAVVCECDVRVLGKRRRGALVTLHALPQVAGVRFGGASGRSGRQLLPAPGRDVPAALAQIPALALGQLFCSRCETRKHVSRSGRFMLLAQA